MKKSMALIIILCSLFFCVGMGGLGGTAPVEKIPTPEKNFTVLVTDRDGVKTSLSQFSHEGKIFLTGKLGEATVTVPFEKISQVQFQSQARNEVLAQVSVKDQKPVEMKVDKQSKFFGNAGFGTFQIESKDLKSIRFQP